MDEKLLTDIEVKLAYQEHTISELNEVVIYQQKTIDNLMKTVEFLKNRFVELEDKIPLAYDGNEKPPHY